MAQRFLHILKKKKKWDTTDWSYMPNKFTTWWGVLNTTLCDSMLFFPQAILFFFAQNKNQNIFWHKKSVRLKWSVLTIMVHTNVDLFIILLSYKYYIIFFSTPYLQCVISYCKCIQELFANNNNNENTQDFIFFKDKGYNFLTDN